MPGQKFVTKERITVRNLRIREDTAMVVKVFYKYAEGVDMSGYKFVTKERITVRNLGIKEAKQR